MSLVGSLHASENCFHVVLTFCDHALQRLFCIPVNKIPSFVSRFMLIVVELYNMPNLKKADQIKDTNHDLRIVERSRSRS